MYICALIAYCTTRSHSRLAYIPVVVLRMCQLVADVYTCANSLASDRTRHSLQLLTRGLTEVTVKWTCMYVKL